MLRYAFLMTRFAQPDVRDIRWRRMATGVTDEIDETREPDAPRNGAISDDKVGINTPRWIPKMAVVIATWRFS